MSSRSSHSLRALETRLGVCLLTRTTRSVAPTDAGERLLETIVPAFQTVGTALDRLSETRGVPAGIVRLTTVKHAAQRVLGPMLPAFLDRFPHITVEIAADDQLRDIVSDRFDAGIRLGERVDKDMISLRISSEIPTAMVAAPAYLEHHPAPASPHDLVNHDCIGHRMGSGALHPWPFEDNGHPFSVR